MLGRMPDRRRTALSGVPPARSLRALCRRLRASPETQPSSHSSANRHTPPIWNWNTRRAPCRHYAAVHAPCQHRRGFRAGTQAACGPLEFYVWPAQCRAAAGLRAIARASRGCVGCVVPPDPVRGRLNQFLVARHFAFSFRG